MDKCWCSRYRFTMGAKKVATSQVPHIVDGPESTQQYSAKLLKVLTSRELEHN